MADSDPKMVLRTVYLPPEFDEKLRVRAFRTNQTKGDLVRKALARLLDDESKDDASLGLAKKSKRASSAPEPKMILRTTYLPPDLDEKLRIRAFRSNRTKGEFIREALAMALNEPVGVVTSSVARTGAKGTSVEAKLHGTHAAKGKVGAKRVARKVSGAKAKSGSLRVGRA